jgi:dimethylargininase
MMSHLLSQAIRPRSNPITKQLLSATIRHKATTTTVAITREIPDSFVDAISFHYDQQQHQQQQGEGDVVVSLQKAREQHSNYINTLKQHIITPSEKQGDGTTGDKKKGGEGIINLPALEPYPDCVFVEDTMVAIDDTAVVTRMGHEKRRGEVASMKSVLLDLEGMRNVYDMNDSTTDDDNGTCCCDGGDVLYTGRHLFVGITNRTNENGYEYLKKVFSYHHGLVNEENVIPIPMMMSSYMNVGKKDSNRGGVLHLKSAVTHIDEETVLLPEGQLGDVLQQIMKLSDRGYKTIRLPDVLSCNAVVVNGHVLAQDSSCSVSKHRIEGACLERGLGVSFVDTSELAKKDAALTCCSVLLSV